jgi:hypothetical protein
MPMVSRRDDLRITLQDATGPPVRWGGLADAPLRE